MILDVEKKDSSDKYWPTEKYKAHIPVWNIKQLFWNEETDECWFELMGEKHYRYYVSKEDGIRIGVAISKMEGVK